jgi:two-component system, cell cycle response regulator DivK
LRAKSAFDEFDEGIHVKKVLVVDDMPDNRELFLQYLEDLYEVVEATNGREAVAVAVEQMPDLILMDLSLPEMTGWEATEVLKRNDTTKKIPVIALTAHAMTGDREKALAAGCDDYLTKPIVANDLINKVRSYIG